MLDTRSLKVLASRLRHSSYEEHAAVTAALAHGSQLPLIGNTCAGAAHADQQLGLGTPEEPSVLSQLAAALLLPKQAAPNRGASPWRACNSQVKGAQVAPGVSRRQERTGRGHHQDSPVRHVRHEDGTPQPPPLSDRQTIRNVRHGDEDVPRLPPRALVVGVCEEVARTRQGRSELVGAGAAHALLLALADAISGSAGADAGAHAAAIHAHGQGHERASERAITQSSGSGISDCSDYGSETDDDSSGGGAGSDTSDGSSSKGIGGDDSDEVAPPCKRARVASPGPGECTHLGGPGGCIKTLKTSTRHHHLPATRAARLLASLLLSDTPVPLPAGHLRSCPPAICARLQAAGVGGEVLAPARLARACSRVHAAVCQAAAGSWGRRPWGGRAGQLRGAGYIGLTPGDGAALALRLGLELPQPEAGSLAGPGFSQSGGGRCSAGVWAGEGAGLEAHAAAGGALEVPGDAVQVVGALLWPLPLSDFVARAWEQAPVHCTASGGARIAASAVAVMGTREGATAAAGVHATGVAAVGAAAAAAALPQWDWRTVVTVGGIAASRNVQASGPCGDSTTGSTAAPNNPRTLLLGPVASPGWLGVLLGGARHVPAVNAGATDAVEVVRSWWAGGQLEAAAPRIDDVPQLQAGRVQGRGRAAGAGLGTMRHGSDVRLVRSTAIPNQMPAGAAAGAAVAASATAAPVAAAREDEGGAPKAAAVSPRAAAAAVAPAVAPSTAVAGPRLQEARPAGSPVSGAECAAALHAGYTVALRALGARDGCVGRVEGALGRVFGLSPGANLYATPPGAQGLPPHFDDHCVFVAQLRGRKCWRLRAPAPTDVLPLAYTRASLAAQPFGPHRGPDELELELCPGELLYIPRGWAHEAVACSDNQSSGPQAATTGHSDAAGDPSSDHGTASPLQESPQHCPQESRTLQGQAPPPPATSLHITFGLEVDPGLSWQALVHTALAAACRATTAAAHAQQPHPQLQAAAPALDSQDPTRTHGQPAMSEQQRGSGDSIGMWEEAEGEAAAAADGPPALCRRATAACCRALLHVWVSDAAGAVPLLRRACALLASPAVWRVLMRGLSLEPGLGAGRMPDYGGRQSGSTTAAPEAPTPADQLTACEVRSIVQRLLRLCVPQEVVRTCAALTAQPAAPSTWQPPPAPPLTTPPAPSLLAQKAALSGHVRRGAALLRGACTCTSSGNGSSSGCGPPSAHSAVSSHSPTAPGTAPHCSPPGRTQAAWQPPHATGAAAAALSWWLDALWSNDWGSDGSDSDRAADTTPGLCPARKAASRLETLLTAPDGLEALAGMLHAVFQQLQVDSSNEVDGAWRYGEGHLTTTGCMGVGAVVPSEYGAGSTVIAAAVRDVCQGVHARLSTRAALTGSLLLLQGQLTHGV